MSALNRFLRRFSLELTVLAVMLGAIMLTFGIFGYKPDWAPSVLSGIIDGIGNWYLWLIFIGPFLLIGGLYYIIDGFRKRREFMELIDTGSKAKFVKNYDRIEELAYSLSEKHQRMVAEKRAEFRMKK